MTYREQLKQPEWEKRRVEKLNSAGFKCEECGASNTTLEIHHIRYVWGRMAWQYTDEELKCLCDHCHEMKHIPACCDTPLFKYVYDPDSRSKLFIPIHPLYCFECGTPIPEHL